MKRPLDDAPNDAGTYIVKIDVAVCDRYDITADHWTFTITKADPKIDLPTIEVPYEPNLKLENVGLSDATGGAWAWSESESGTVIPSAGNHRYEATFTPTDSDNYNTVTQFILVQVGKADLAIDNFTFTPLTNNIYSGSEISPTVNPNGITGVGDITLKYRELQVTAKGELAMGDQKDEAPTDVGTYGVSIDVTEDVNYNKAKDLKPDWEKEFKSNKQFEKLPWTFSILPAAPQLPEAPKSDDEFSYGEKLDSWKLSPAGWKWVDPSIILAAVNNGYTAYYSVKGIADDYNWGEAVKNVDGFTFKQASGSLPDRIEAEVTPSVILAIPDYTEPENLTATYGDTLGSVVLGTGWNGQPQNNL